jgi:hypothetical protein
MISFLEFRQRVKGNVNRTTPTPAGLWYRSLEEDVPEADKFVIWLCYGFLQGGTDLDDVASGILSDDDLLWYVQQFVDREAKAIQKPQDNEPLVVGLAAVSIIAPKSDPRDVTGWIDTLFQAARTAGVRDIPVYFERVAAQLQGTCPLAADQMRSYPRVVEEFEARKPNKET